MEPRVARTLVALVAVTALLVAAPVVAARRSSDEGELQGVGPLHSVPTAVPVVALTIDDGPTGSYTPTVLGTLQRYRAHATFFVVGEDAVEWPGLIRRESSSGNEVAVHTWSHPQMSDLTSEQTRAQIASCARAIERLTGTRPLYARPPRGTVTQAGLDAARAEGMRTILWSVSLDNSRMRTPREKADRVLALVKPGDIILMHDGRGHREATVEALDLLLAGLRDRGYRVVSVSELLALTSEPSQR